MRLIASCFIAVLMAACAITGGTFGTSPEQQIFNGANAHKAASTLATVLLRNNKVTVVQAKGYSNILHTLSAHLDDTNKALLDCRKRTSSTAKSSPDPCAASVDGDIRLVLSGVAEVQKLLKERE